MIPPSSKVLYSLERKMFISEKRAVQCNVWEKILIFHLFFLIFKIKETLQVRRSVVQLCIALSDHSYVDSEGGDNVIAFLVKNLVPPTEQEIQVDFQFIFNLIKLNLFLKYIFNFIICLFSAQKTGSRYSGHESAPHPVRPSSEHDRDHLQLRCEGIFKIVF